MELPKDFFHDPNEHLIATLGQGYLANWILHGQIEKTCMVLSDRRVYAFGKISQRAGVSISNLKGKQTVSIEQVTGTGYVEKSMPIFKILGWIFTTIGVIGIIGLISLIFTGDSSRIDEIFVISISFLLIPLVIGIILLVINFIKSGKFFFVEYSGGGMGTKCKFHSQTELDNFQRMISLEKDKRNQ